MLEEDDVSESAKSVPVVSVFEPVVAKDIPILDCIASKLMSIAPAATDVAARSSLIADVVDFSESI